MSCLSRPSGDSVSLTASTKQIVRALVPLLTEIRATDADDRDAVADAVGSHLNAPPDRTGLPEVLWMSVAREELAERHLDTHTGLHVVGATVGEARSAGDRRVEVDVPKITGGPRSTRDGRWCRSRSCPARPPSEPVRRSAAAAASGSVRFRWRTCGHDRDLHIDHLVYSESPPVIFGSSTSTAAVACRSSSRRRPRRREARCACRDDVPQALHERRHHNYFWKAVRSGEHLDGIPRHPRPRRDRQRRLHEFGEQWNQSADDLLRRSGQRDVSPLVSTAGHRRYWLGTAQRSCGITLAKPLELAASP